LHALAAFPFPILMLSEGRPIVQPALDSVRSVPFFLPQSPADIDSEWDNLPVRMNPPGEARE